MKTKYIFQLKNPPNDGASYSVAGKEAFDSFEKFMAAKAALKRRSVQSIVQSCIPATNISKILNDFENDDSFQQNIPIRVLWENIKDTYPELNELASIINSIPPTQASVERSFSMRNVIYTIYMSTV